jgi:hypothetical protein
MIDVIRSLNDEVVDETKDERTAHRQRDDPCADPGLPAGDAETGERSDQDNDVDEQGAGRVERDLRARMRHAVDQGHRKVRQHDCSKTGLTCPTCLTGLTCPTCLTCLTCPSAIHIK